MRRHVIQLACVAIVLVVLGSHVSELLDQWDHTLQTGNDIESVLVVLALTVGAVLSLAGSVVIAAVASLMSRVPPPKTVQPFAEAVLLPVTSHSPPPFTLRI